MQHDLFANPSRRQRIAFPLIVTLQADVADGEHRVVVPLTVATQRTPQSRMVPIVEHEDQNYAVIFNLMASIPLRLLRHPVGSIARHNDELTRALDWLFCGI